MTPINVLLKFYQRSFSMQPTLFHIETQSSLHRRKEVGYLNYIPPSPQGSDDVSEEGIERL